MKKVIENNGIDVYPQSGKVGGAFACKFGSIKGKSFFIEIMVIAFSDAINRQAHMS